MSALSITARFKNVADAIWSGATPVAEANSWLRESLRKISELAQLPENWDSYGSRSIQEKAVRQASEALDVLSDLDLPPPQIFPVPGGGLQLEFDQDGRGLEIEFLPDGTIEYLMVADNGEMREGSIPYGSRGDLHLLAYWLQGKLEAAFLF
jgi:hypothetical protein